MPEGCADGVLVIPGGGAVEARGVGYHKAYAKSIGWETVASTNRTDRFWIGLDEIYDDHEDLD
jgi:hypothetical protein